MAAAVATSQNVSQPAAPDVNAAIVVDTSLDDDGESALGSDVSSGSTSVTSSIQNYKYENGRRYHAYREGEYILPNDETEQDRLDLLHHIFRVLLDGRLFRAPIIRKPQRVLDFGTGTGIWAIDFADEFPGAEVIGTDLSPIQPSWVPPGCRFYVDDVESEWAYGPSEAFDFIHGRGMGGSIRDWKRLYAQAYANLKPGGWIEMQEYETVIQSDDTSINKAPYVQQFMNLINEASEKFGKKLNEAPDQKQHLIDAGFVKVQDDTYKLPCGIWPKDPKLKDVGRYQVVQFCDAIEPYSMALFTRMLGWSKEECQVLAAKVRKELCNREIHLYNIIHFVYGQRPEDLKREEA